jgi:hypothetical protein
MTDEEVRSHVARAGADCREADSMLCCKRMGGRNPQAAAQRGKRVDLIQLLAIFLVKLTELANNKLTNVDS